MIVIVIFYRRHRKLQRKVANIHFDLTSSDSYIKGCILNGLVSVHNVLFDDAHTYIETSVNEPLLQKTLHCGQDAVVL